MLVFLFVFSEDAGHVLQLRLEVVDGQLVVGHSGSHAVLAEAVGVYVQLAQHLQHGRVAQSVALQFDDDQRSHVAVTAGDDVMEKRNINT